MNYVKSLYVPLSILFAAQTSLANLKDAKLFIKSAFKNPHVVGAVLPSSHGVGEELTRYVLRSQKENPGRPLRILEVGAGTGSMSEVISSHVKKFIEEGVEIQVDLIEISSDFCQILHDKFDQYPYISIRCLSVLDWQPTECYDFIISTLPFNSFEYELMDNIINHLTKLIKPGGVISYVAYAGIAEVKKHLLWGKKKIEHVKKIKRLEQWRAHRLKRKKTILKNVPPINIYHLQFD